MIGRRSCHSDVMRAVYFFVALSAVLSGPGCNRPGDPDLSLVEGTVTLDGKPVPAALVTFQPTFGAGTYSRGRTDNTGTYQLVYSRTRRGAMVGEHQITISTLVNSEDIQGRPIKTPEIIPPQYNKNTELVREVVAGRTNTINFELESGGSSPTSRERPR